MGTLIFGLIAATCYHFALRLYVEGAWPTTSGTYISDRTGISNGGGGRHGGGGTSRFYEVSFTYTVIGARHTGSERYGAFANNPEEQITLYKGGAHR